MKEILSGVFLLLGTVSILLSAIGVLKMPDLYIRMSATTKASTFGIGLVLVGTMFYWLDTGVTMRALSIIVFLFLTAPVAAHIIARAAYYDGVPFWEKTTCNEMEEQLKKTTSDRDSSPIRPPRV